MDNTGYAWGDAQPLQFTQETYSAFVNETTVRVPRPIPGFVTVACLQSNTSNNITYQLSNSNSFFTLDTNTGELMATVDLDYEANTFYHMRVLCFNEVFLSVEAQINVTVLPVNEYRPTISTRTEQVTLPEGTLIGTVIISTLPGDWIVYNASDLDTGPHGIIYYTALTDNRIFGFNSTVGALYLSGNFDLDMTQTIFRREQIVITVCDSNPPTSDCLNLIVVVFLISGNDNAPVFSSLLLNVSFSETLNLGSTIAIVECTDEDYVVGTLEGYEIVSVYPPQTLQGTFTVSNTGEITTDNLLDFELTNVYEIQVRCFDSSFEDFATVTVVVRAANDNTPQFTESSLNVSIPESAEPFTIIAQLSCVDSDVLIGELSGYELNNESLQNFAINSTGTIILASFLDFEETRMHELKVRCFDSGIPIRDNVTTVTVNVIPINEHPPKFRNSTVMNVSILESVPMDTVVATVECSDQDHLQGELDSYELVSISPSQTPLQAFHINSTGTIVTGMPLDLEANDFYELQIRCFDSGFPVMEDFATVRVRLVDVNDNNPQCSQIPTQNLMSGTHNQQYIFTLNCTDRDIGLNSQLRYSLTTISPLLRSGLIVINMHTGDVNFFGTINDNRNYTIYVQVSDLGTLSRSTTVSFVLIVEGAVILPTNPFPLWAIIVIVVVGLVLVCCLLMCLMCCSYICFLQRSGKKYLDRYDYA